MAETPLARRLIGASIPDVALTGGDGRPVRLTSVIGGPSILYVYPGGEDGEVTDEHGETPGRRGRRNRDGRREPSVPSSCAVQRRSFRDLALDFAAYSVKIVGVGCEPHTLQRQLVRAEQLPFTLLSDPSLTLADAVQLPTFDDRGVRRYRRLTMVTGPNGRIEAVFYPVSPKRGAMQVLSWMGRTWRP